MGEAEALYNFILTQKEGKLYTSMSLKNSGTAGNYFWKLILKTKKIHNKDIPVHSIKTGTAQLGKAVHACNPSYSGDRGRRIMV
jgi:hypothetical protein